MTFGKFDFKTLIQKDTKSLQEIMNSKKEELNKKQQHKSYLIGHILWLQEQINKT